MNIHDETTAGAPTGNANTEGARRSEGSEKQAEHLEQEIEEIRDHLGGLVTELDHRRHRLNPVTMVRRDPWPFAVGGAVLIGAIVGGIAWRHARTHRRVSWVDRGQRIRALLGLPATEPEKRSEPSIGRKVLAAAATAAAAVAARRAATRLFAHSDERDS